MGHSAVAMINNYVSIANTTFANSSTNVSFNVTETIELNVASLNNLKDNLKELSEKA